MIIGGLNQFKQNAIENICDEINIIGGTLMSPTTSLCHECHYHIPAYRYELKGSVYICKNCITHGLSHHMIERDATFYRTLEKTEHTLWHFDSYVLVEVTDRCNLECPHCYHLPDNKIKDRPREEIINLIKSFPKSLNTIVLAGAEPTLRKDFVELLQDLNELNVTIYILTNGIKLADEDFVNELIDKGFSEIYFCVGLNHPSYAGSNIIRRKQEHGIRNALTHFQIGYISYSLIDLTELDDVLTEITAGFNKDSEIPELFRIRCGSEIGRNATADPVFLSDLYKAVVAWATQRGLVVRKHDADNNIYHQVIELDGKIIRLIHWCNETNIDLEELRSGPWNAFVPNDGITNFLHQIIRRDTWKNKGLILPDVPPIRYTADHQGDNTAIFKLDTLGSSVQTTDRKD
jgi:hypothetical protein